MAKINTPRVNNNKYHITETVKILELPNRLNIYVSYVETEAIMIINVNLQLILCNKCRILISRSRSHYMHDTNQDQEWSQGDDHNDQEQPFQ